MLPRQKRRVFGALSAILLIAAALVLWQSRARQPANTPTQPGAIRYVVSWDMTDWDPSTSYDNTSIVLSNLYEPLLWVRHDNGQTTFTPALAISYEKSTDGLTWQFRLREGVKFHDGSAFDSSAVKASIERTMKLAQGASWIWDAVKQIEAPERFKVIFHLKYPAPLDLIVSSGFGAWVICPSKLAPDQLNDSRARFTAGRACGTGPYKVRKWVPQQEVILERFDEYWRGWDNTSPRDISISTVTASTTQLQLIQSGDGDILRQPPLDVIGRLEKDPQINIVRYKSFESIVGLLNLRRPPTDSAAVRSALIQSANIDEIVSKVLYGFGRPSTGPVSTSLWGARTESLPEKFDPKAAQEKLGEVRRQGALPKLTLTYTTGEDVLKNVALALQAQWRNVGIELAIEEFPWSIQWTRAKDSNTAPNIFLFYWWPTYPTPHDALNGMFKTEDPPSYNLSRFSNPQFDALIDRAARLTVRDRDAAEKLYRQAGDLVVESSAAIFVADLERAFAIRRRVKNFKVNAAYPNVVLFYDLQLAN